MTHLSSCLNDSLHVSGVLLFQHDIRQGMYTSGKSAGSCVGRSRHSQRDHDDNQREYGVHFSTVVTGHIVGKFLFRLP